MNKTRLFAAIPASFAQGKKIGVCGKKPTQNDAVPNFRVPRSSSLK
jgi:hypothetical protein